MSHGHQHVLPEMPARLSMSGAVQALAAAGVLAGAGALGWAFTQGDAALAWSSYLIGVFYALGLGLFGVAWLAILHLSGGTLQADILKHFQTVKKKEGRLGSQSGPQGGGNLEDWPERFG